ncbi:S-layer homology domain-containing protein, partial [Patescibacteria group bacterium]|nr:S-layer homology domain-containing protein [Patescibacteria group bacterium]
GSSTDISKAQRELYIKQLEDLIAKYNALLSQKKTEAKSYCEINPNDALCKKATSDLEATLAKIIEKMAQKSEAEEKSKTTPDLNKIQMAQVAEQAATRRSKNVGITNQQINEIMDRCFPNLSKDEWYTKPIAQAENNGLIECAAKYGKEFNPAEFINRAEGSKLLVCVLKGKEECERLIVQPNSYPQIFSDVPTEAWYSNLVSLLYSEGYLIGYATDDGRELRPGNPFTRVAVLKLMMDMYGITPSLKAVESLPFSDVSKDVWYSQYVSEAFSKGLIRGYVDGTFRPANAINRVEILTIIDRFDTLIIQEYEITNGS